MSGPSGAERNWAEWQPTERATLCFVVRENEILLIRKKRGLGAGKVNGPGGRIDPGETPRQCAIRETQEELGVTPLDPEWRGELYFQFVDGYGLQCAVFTARGCEGNAVETDEAAPLWTPLNAIPFHEMWADDIHWLPGVLEGRNFRGYFDFDGDTMLSRRIEWLERGRTPDCDAI